MNGVILCQAALEFFLEELPKLPGNYLEIGVYDGRLISTLADKFPERKFFGIDPFIEDGYTTYHNGGVPVGAFMPQQFENAKHNIYARPNGKLMVMPSTSFKDLEALDAMNLSAVLIDGSHHYPDVTNDFFLAMMGLKNGGVIFADDLTVPEVERACIEFIQREFKRIAKWEGNKFWINPIELK